MKPKNQSNGKNKRKKPITPRDALYSYITDLEALPFSHPNLPQGLVKEHEAMIQKAWELFDAERTGKPITSTSL